MTVRQRTLRGHCFHVALMALAVQAVPLDPGRLRFQTRLNWTAVFACCRVSHQAGDVDNSDPPENRPVSSLAFRTLHVGSTALRLGANTAFRFLNLDDQTVQIRLSEGTLTVRMRNFIL